MFKYKYARPAVSVDCVVFGVDEEDLKVLLIQRKLDPFRGHWALPGGFVRVDESLEQAATRELEEETGVSIRYLEQLYTFGEVDRDPRERVITVAYYALVNLRDHCPTASSDAQQAAWYRIDDAPALAFDHEEILAVARRRLENKVRYEPIGFELLPKKFTLRQLQHLYECILQRPLDKRNFRKKLLGMDILVELEEFEQSVPHRAARLFQFDRPKYRRLQKRGFMFEL